MPDYRKMYLTLFDAVERTLEVLDAPEQDTALAKDLLIAAQQIVGADVVILRQLDQMPHRQLIGAPLVPGVHGLGRAQHIGNLLLCFVVILP